MSQPRQLVLIANDYETDRSFLKELLRLYAPEMGILEGIHRSDLVIDYLAGRGCYANRETYPLPQLLILDLRLPCMSGIQILSWLGASNFPSLKVIMLGNSLNPLCCPGIEKLAKHQIYMVPMTVEELVHIVEKLNGETAEQPLLVP